jgi:hypothetical protein
MDMDVWDESGPKQATGLRVRPIEDNSAEGQLKAIVGFCQMHQDNYEQSAGDLAEAILSVIELPF